MIVETMRRICVVDTVAHGQKHDSGLDIGMRDTAVDTETDSDSETDYMHEPDDLDDLDLETDYMFEFELEIDAVDHTHE